jgi:hypothetical protein
VSLTWYCGRAEARNAVGLLKATAADLAPPTEEERIVGLARATLAQVSDDRLAGGRADRHHPLA